MYALRSMLFWIFLLKCREGHAVLVQEIRMVSSSHENGA